jgi:YHS domain-containing protein
MFRLITYLLMMVVLITIVRNAIGFLVRLFGHAVAAKSVNASKQSVPLTGEFKKDPVCGTYIAAETSLHETVAGQTFYFCSTYCRDKFALVGRASRPVHPA